MQSVGQTVPSRKDWISNEAVSKLRISNIMKCQEQFRE